MKKIKLNKEARSRLIKIRGVRVVGVNKPLNQVMQVEN